MERIITRESEGTKNIVINQYVKVDIAGCEYKQYIGCIHNVEEVEITKGNLSGYTMWITQEYSLGYSAITHQVSSYIVDSDSDETVITVTLDIK